MTANRERERRERQQRPTGEPPWQRRRQRRLEVILAAFLTVAAVGFIIAALVREERGALRAPSVEAERKPITDAAR